MYLGDYIYDFTAIGDDKIVVVSLIGALAAILSYLVLRNLILRGDRKMSALISIIIGAMSAIYLYRNEWEYFITIPYRYFGLFLIFFFPLLIIIYFIHKSSMSGVGRKITLIIFMIAIGIVWLTQFLEGNVSNSYVFIALLVLCGILIFLDRSVHKLMKYRDN